MLNLIFKRRSIRAYTQEPVTPEQIEALLQAAMAAPSANDLRPWAFVVVREAARRRSLAQTHQWSGMCAEAPIVVAVLGDPTTSQHWVEDCSAATENLLLTAVGFNLGTVWIGVYPHREREDHVRRTLSIPGHFRVLCLVATGHPAEQKEPRTRFEASKVFYETCSKR